MKKVIYIVFLLLFFSCNPSDKEVSGINISNELYENLSEKNIPKDEYVNLIKMSLNKDKSSLIKLSLLDFNSILDFEHGEVLLSIIEKIGIDNYILSINNCSAKQKEIIYNHLENGFEWNNNPLYKNKNLKLVYPKIYNFLIKE